MSIEPNESPLSQGEKFAVFRLGEELYGIRLGLVQEIITPQPITRIPGAPNVVKGVLNLRGRVLPIADLHPLFGLNLPVSRKTACIVIVQLEIDPKPVSLGLLVDDVPRVLAIEPSQVEECPPLGLNVDPEFIEGIARTEVGVIIMINTQIALIPKHLEKMLMILLKNALVVTMVVFLL